MRRKHKAIFGVIVVIALLVGVPLWIVDRAFLREKATHELTVAVYKNDTKAALAALRVGADANARRYADEKPQTPIQFVRRLWRRQSIIGSAAAHRPPLIGLAAKQNNASLMKALLEFGANPNAHSQYAHDSGLDERDPTSGHTPLYWVGVWDNAIATCTLLNKGADPNLCGRQSDNPPLLLTIDAAIVKPLLDHGALMNAPSQDRLEWKFTALHRCAQKSRDLHSLRLLLERGANVNARSGDGSTPLMCAAASGNIEHLNLLLAHGADVNATDDAGETALLLAIKNENQNNEAHQIVLHLIHSGVNVNLKDGRRASPLAFAEINGKTGIVKLLLAAGAKR